MAEGTNIGRINLGLDIDRGLFNKQLSGLAAGANKTVMSAFKPLGKIIGGALAVGSIVAFTKSCIGLGSDLAEVQNVVDVTFTSLNDKVNEFAQSAIEKFGLSETVAKKMMGTYGAMTKSFGFTESQAYDMSEAITGLTADVASFYNLSTDEAYIKMKSIWTGETESLKELGVVMTQTALDQYAMNNGFGKTTASMTEQEKVMLRYQFVQSQLSAASGDFARTSGGWANQIRVLTLRFQQLKATLGQGFINLFTPIIKMLNAFIAKIQGVANAFLRLTEIITGKEAGSLGNMAADTADVATAAGDASDNISGMGDSAASAAKKASRALAGFDQINKLSEDTASKSGSGGSGGSTSGAAAGSGAITKELDAATQSASKLEKQLTDMVGRVKKAWETGDFSEIGTIVGTKISDSLEKINWNKINTSAYKIGSSLATFLDGIFETPGLFENVGKTAAEAVNTAISASLGFAENFHFDSAGAAIGEAINGFFRNLNVKEYAESINYWVQGIKDTVVTALKTVSWSTILGKGLEFLTHLDLETIAITFGTFKWFFGGKEIVAGALKTILDKQISTGIGDGKVSISTGINLSITAAIVGFKVGNWLYDNCSGIQKVSDAIAAWITKDGTEFSVSKTITVALAGLSISIPAVLLGNKIAQAATEAVAGEISLTGVKLALTNVAIKIADGANWLGITALVESVAARLGMALTGVKLALTNVAVTIADGANYIWLGITSLAESFVSALGTAISGLASVGSTIVSAVGTALSNAASFLTSSVSSVFAGGAASIAAGLFAAIGAAIAGWNIGQLIYNKFSEQIDSIVTTVGDFFTQTIPQALSNANKTIVNLAVNVKGNIDQKAQEVKDWFADKKEQVKNFVAIAKDNASDILNSLKDKWNAIQDKTPKLIANVIDSSNGVLDSLKSKWEAIKDKTPKLIATAEEGKKSALATIKSAWGAIYKKSVKLTASAKNKDSKVLKTIKSAWNSIKDKSAELSVTFRDAFTSKIKAAWNGLAKAINKGIDKINKIPGVNISHIATFATGGFPEEGPFMMNRGEIAGKFSNGKGVVANNMQITTGISKAVGPAVYQATKAAMQVALPSVHTPSLAASTDHSDKTMEKMLDCLLRMASDGNQDVVVMLKELLKYLKETPRDTYLDGTKITGRVVEIINTMTEVNKKCPIKV